MIKNKNLPQKISVFPLSNFIIFPNTSVPLNIFEPRYIEMIDDSMKTDRIIGIIQPKKQKKDTSELYTVGWEGKITSFKETNDGRYLIDLKGIIRFKINKELKSNKKYRECEVSYESFSKDLSKEKDELKFADLKLILNDLKNLFKRQGYVINWKDIEKQSLSQTINTLSMASPFTLEEKQILLETKNLVDRKKRLEEILVTYTNFSFANKTIQ